MSVNAAPPQGKCPQCQEVVLVDHEGRCLWCDTTTEPAASPKPRRPLRPDDGRRRYQGRIPEEAVRAAHVVYVRQGLSCRQIGALIWERYGFASPAAAGESLFRAFRRFGLRMRTQREVTIARNYKHGRKTRAQTNEEQVAYRHWLAEQRGWERVQGPGQPQCEGVKQQPPRKGKRCERAAMEGSRFCVSHDPARQLEHQARLARARRRMAPREMVPLEPFAQWILRRRYDLGSQKALAEHLGVSRSTISDLIWRRDGNGHPKGEIGRETVERYLERDGTTSFEELYGQPECPAVAA